ncbi:MAG: nucleotidyl transferase AbiEii/AbiGii toxin family protein [Nitrospirota bacterium]
MRNFEEIVSGPVGKPDEVFHLMTLISAPHSKQPVKVDFVEDIFSGCWLPQKMKTLETHVEFTVDSLEAILHKKLYAIYSNKMHNKPPRTKDILDIYILFRDTFHFDAVREFYRDSRDLTLPFNAVMRAIKDTGLDFNGILAVSSEIQKGVSLWQQGLIAIKNNNIY